MKFTLLTYDSTLAHNAGYYTSSAAAFAEHLARLVDQFAAASGIEKSKIYWMPVEYSDWCRGMLILYATVPQDWTPTAETCVYDVIFSPDWFPYSATSLSGWVSGKAGNVNINDSPAKQPHCLFRSVEQPLFTPEP